MRTTRWVAAAIVVDVVAGVGAAIALQPPAPVSVDHAVAKFRTQLAASAHPATTRHPIRAAADSKALPATTVTKTVPVVPQIQPSTTTAPAGLVTAQPGVYVYDTTGQEQVNKPSKTTHKYPRSTTLTASGSACDAHLAWQPIEGRNLEIAGCYDKGAFRLTGIATTQTFFGYRTRSVYACPGSNVVVPARPTPGTRWTFDCDAARTHASIDVSVIGNETRSVTGQAVPTWHVRFDVHLSGATRGTQIFDFWFAARDALPIAITSVTDVDEDTSFGTVHYAESFALSLAELAPRT